MVREKKTRGNLTESQIQASFFQYIRSKYANTPIELLTFSTLNGVYIPIPAISARMRREGMKKGIPDLVCLIPVKPYHGLVIEFKRHPNKPTSEQLEFLTAAVGQKYKAGICYSVEEAISLFDAYLASRL